MKNNNNNQSLRERYLTPPGQGIAGQGMTSSVIRFEDNKQDSGAVVAKRLFKELEDKQEDRLKYEDVISLINQQRNKGRK